MKSQSQVYAVVNVHEKHSTISVAIAKGVHLFSYRTQKLSLSTQMVLGWTRPGRVCSRRIPKEKHQRKLVLFLYFYYFILFYAYITCIAVFTETPKSYVYRRK